MRERFVGGRLTRPAAPGELKDLTDFFHTETADLVACDGCGLLLRNEHERPPAEDYSEEEYDPDVLERQYPEFVNAFRNKEVPFRSMLPVGACVLEIGSQIGAFLQVAAEWGWSAEAVDPGKDTSRFAQSKGFVVHTGTVQECRFGTEEFDGIFIWNCFDQIEQPAPALACCQRILRRGGLLTVRTPDGQFYAICQRVLRNPDVRDEAKEFILRAMGYNNLLGFPYFYGYSRATLQRMIESHGFQFGGALPSELLSFPLPENPDWVEQEQGEISSELQLLQRSVLRDTSGNSFGPWIEAWFHKR
jgi:2-polyprenyl-3-methyl-5-hydroxy-6-metoxy-1,4-benzoquinol methylase